MYKVIRLFTDLQNGHVYNVGDKFPKDGVQVTENRIAELASSKNRQGVPLIAKAEEKKKPNVANGESLNLATPAQQLTPVEQGTPRKKETSEEIRKDVGSKNAKRGRRSSRQNY